jgi:hypothetical protein
VQRSLAHSCSLLSPYTNSFNLRFPPQHSAHLVTVWPQRRPPTLSSNGHTWGPGGSEAHCSTPHSALVRFWLRRRHPSSTSVGGRARPVALPQLDHCWTSEVDAPVAGPHGADWGHRSNCPSLQSNALVAYWPTPYLHSSTQTCVSRGRSADFGRHHGSYSWPRAERTTYTTTTRGGPTTTSLCFSLGTSSRAELQPRRRQGPVLLGSTTQEPGCCHLDAYHYQHMGHHFELRLHALDGTMPH